MNSQHLVNPLVCLGDGHDGFGALINELATPDARSEILDWYHNSENLYKVGGELLRLKQAESCLWQGQVDEAIALFTDCRRKQARNFIDYLNKHRQRIVNYEYYQAEQLCSIGSGAVESAIKQIDLRMKLVGAQWDDRLCQSDVTTPLCRSQWSTGHLRFLQKRDAPVRGRSPLHTWWSMT